METICPGASVHTPPTQLHPTACYQSPGKTQSRGYIDISDNLSKLKLTFDLHTEEKGGNMHGNLKYSVSFPQIVY